MAWGKWFRAEVPLGGGGAAPGITYESEPEDDLGLERITLEDER